MSRTLENNAYRIFGLDTGVNQKDILKRYKEIINRLKIDDIPEYDIDINVSNKLRTEESVNDALKRLQNVKNNIREYFFWFQISDTVDEKAFGFLKTKDFTKAIQTWKSASDTKNTTALFYKKNLNLIYCLLLLKEQNSTYLKESLSNWHEIVSSDKFWSAFEKSYGVNNDLSISSDLISDFKKNVIKNISDIYTELYQQHKNVRFVKDFQEIFGIHGDKTEKDVLKPLYQTMYDTIEELNKIKFDDDTEEDNPESEDKCNNCGDTNAEKYWDYDDGSVLCEKCHKKIGQHWQKKIDEEIEGTVEGSEQTVRKILKVIAKLQSQLDQLQKTGLYDDKQSKIVRDHVAEAVRNASVMIHNEAHMSKKSAELLKLAHKISGTDSVKEKYDSELKQIKKIADNEEKNALVLNIPKFWGNKDLIVKNTYMEYEGTKIFYKDAVAVSYHAVRNTTYGIETSQKFTFSLSSSREGINLTFSNEEELWVQLINISKQLIEPQIIAKYLKAIFEKGQTITIGNVDFDDKGYHRSKFFGGIESVYWKDTIYIPQLSQGYVVLFKSKDGVGKQFTTISMEDSNSVIMPEFLQACVEEYAIRHPK